MLSSLEQKIQDILQPYVGSIMATSIVKVALDRCGIIASKIDDSNKLEFLEELKNGAKFYFRDADKRDDCFKRLNEILESPVSTVKIVSKEYELEINQENDIVLARNHGRKICKDLDFPFSIQIKVATAISELTRNIVNYVGSGKIILEPLTTKPIGIQIIALDDGPGITNLENIMSGNYSSQRGLGLGLRGTKELMDEFDIQTGENIGTKVTVRKYLR